MVQGEWNHPYLLKCTMFLKIGVRKLGLESGKGTKKFENCHEESCSAAPWNRFFE